MAHTTSLTFTTVKFADEETSKLGFGLAVFNVERRLDLMLVQVPWRNEMNSFSSEDWAWFVALLVHSCSDCLMNIALTLRDLDGSWDFYMHYKFCPARPEEFTKEVAISFNRISRLPRFSDDSNSVFFGYTLNIEKTVCFGMRTSDIKGDAALVFDTKFHWQRAGELLSCPLADHTMKPGCSYRIGDVDIKVLDHKNKWHASPAAYIEHRIRTAARESKSSLPEPEEIQTICDLMVDLASADETEKNGINPTSLEEYVVSCTRKLKNQKVPKVMREAFEKYGVFIPEMAEMGAVIQCASCKEIAPRGVKYSYCPCFTVRYCSRECKLIILVDTLQSFIPNLSDRSKDAPAGS